MAVLVDVRYLCPECGYAYSNGAEPLADRDLGAETQRAREIGECHMKEVHGTEPPEKDPSWRGALEGVVRHHTTRLDQIAARVQACEINASQKSQKVTALAESLSRRLDALEKQAGPIGKLYVTDVEHATGTVSFDTKDPKDALIRDLMTWLSDHHVYPYVIWDDTKNGFRDRAEKLGIKL